MTVGFTHCHRQFQVNQIAQVEVTPSIHIVVIGVRTCTDKACIFVHLFLTTCKLYQLRLTMLMHTQNENVHLYGPILYITYVAYTARQLSRSMDLCAAQVSMRLQFAA